MLRVRRYAISGLTAALLLSQAGLGSIGAEAPQYTVEDLGTVGGLVPTVTGINTAGQVSGFVGSGDESRAVRLMGSTGWSYVPGLQSLTSTAQAINASGDVTGYVVTAAGLLRAYRYTETTGVLQLIEPMAGGSYTQGTAINASGEVTGYGDAANGAMPSFRSAPGSTVAQTLPHLGGALSFACGINDDGQIVGAGFTAEFAQHLFRVNPDNSVLELSGFTDPGTSGGCGIDSTGRIVGQATLADGTPHAFEYGGTFIDLDTFGSTSSNAEAISNGRSVGAYTASDGTFRAFLHTAADGSVDLNTRIPADSGWTLTQAHGVNASGQIVGEGVLNGVTHAVRLSPKVDAPPPPPPPPPPPGDTTAPRIRSLVATPDNIWPPFGQWVKVSLLVKATDNSGVAPSCELTKITADEGSPSDAKITGALTAQVRALRNHRYDERVYTFEVTCADKAGNEAQATVDVTVAKDQKCRRQAISRGALRGKCILAALLRRTPRGGQTPHR